jgi:hypothetical protein
MGDLEIIYDDDWNTVLSGKITDQTAPHGILKQILDLGLILISIVLMDVRF